MKKNKEDFKIREATNEDSKAIVELIFNIWINEYKFQVNKEDFPDLHKIEDYYTQKGGLFLVAQVGGQIVGTVACDRLNNTDFALKRMFVSESFRGQGIAQALLDELLNRKTFNYSCSFFLSTNENKAISAKKLYLKNGFKTIGKQDLPQNFPIFYEDDLFMAKCP